MRAIFRNCRLIGRRFRLAHVYFRDGKIIEVATFRKNPVDVGDDVPQPTPTCSSPATTSSAPPRRTRVRRDFTVNGLFYDPFLGEVIDYVGGRADLEAHRMSTIGDPEVRMREDPVRALRAVRFAARLGFTIEPETFEAMRRHAGELARCAPPRVLEEIFKILRCGGAARAFELLRACGAAPGRSCRRWSRPSTPGTRRGARFIAHLAALDELVRAGEEVSEAVLLGALLVHLRGRRRGGGPAADVLLAELVQTARLPRKMAERTRLALQAQRLFHEPPRGAAPPRRAGRPGLLHRRAPAPADHGRGHRRRARRRWHAGRRRRSAATRSGPSRAPERARCGRRRPIPRPGRRRSAPVRRRAAAAPAGAAARRSAGRTTERDEARRGAAGGGRGGDAAAASGAGRRAPPAPAPPRAPPARARRRSGRAPTVGYNPPSPAP